VNRKVFAAGCLGMACIAGIITGHALSGLVPCRSALGLLFGRGELLALVKGEGIYEQDVSRAVREERYLSGRTETSKSLPELRAALSRLITNATLRHQAQQKSIPESAVDREYQILQAQLRDKKTWSAALALYRFSADSVRAEIARNLGSERLIEERLVDQTKVTTVESRDYYDAHKMGYVLPVRFRARHLFLASPPETPPEVVDVKKRAIEMLGTRLAHGEDFAELARLCSEDEATKTCGGDLGFFSEHRMPPDFIAAIKNMQAGEVSPIVRTRLGFHIIQLLETKPSRQMSFDEAETGVSLILGNEGRRNGCAVIAAELSNRADFVRFPSHID
jgi:parvulin-like peptidyl-prolyl isomerase